MTTAILSDLFLSRTPSAIRLAQMEFHKRKDETQAINTAIGNVNLPMHPAMIQRMSNLTATGSPFQKGVVKYTSTLGLEETNQAFLNILAASGFPTRDLFSLITEGSSQAMELMLLGTCGPQGGQDKPLLVINPAYTNYLSLAKRLNRRIISVTRTLQEDGHFTLPDFQRIEEVIAQERPGAMVIIPYDNPTGQLMDKKAMENMAGLCVKYNMWLVSDEAYRELSYTDEQVLSIWGLDQKRVPGIQGRRISLESTSKVWNACGLRIGAIITDSPAFHEKALAENTATLCSNAIGQYIFGAIAHEEPRDLHEWYHKQKNYYSGLLDKLNAEIKKELPGIIVSCPDASIYSVVDVRNICPPGFDAMEFVTFCAREGKVSLGGQDLTLLTAPLAGFYSGFSPEDNPGRTQMRIAYVESPEHMALVPRLFSELLRVYLAK